jgi:hypothetical protein
MTAYRDPAPHEVPESLREPVWHRVVIVLLVALSIVWPWWLGVFLWRLKEDRAGITLLPLVFIGYASGAALNARIPIRYLVVMVAWWPVTWLVLGARRGWRWIVRGE